MLIPLTVRSRFRRILEPLARGFLAAGISPSTLTVIGFVPAVIAAIFFARGSVRLGGVLMGVSGIFDLADGLVARIGKRETKFGALLDSSIDRYSELAIFVGLAVLYRGDSGLYAVMLALTGSMMVSYTKARAEGLGIPCNAGMLQRPERMVIVIVGALIGSTVLRYAVWLVAVLANITAVERLLKVRAAINSTKQADSAGETT